MAKNDGRYIQLLNNAELEALYAPPQLNDEEREFYFFLNEQELKLLDQYTQPQTALSFILQLGYFRAKHLFFDLNKNKTSLLDDIHHIARRYGCCDVGDDLSQFKIGRDSLRDQKRVILDLFNYRKWSVELAPAVCAHLSYLVKLFPKGNDTMRELLVFFEKERITLPSYRVIQDMFTESFSAEKDRLDKILLQLSDNIQTKLEALIKNNDGLTQLNIMRYDQKDFKYHSIRDEVKKARSLSELYSFAKTFIPELTLSTNAVRYYASLVEQYPASRLRKLNKSQQWLYVLCFVFYRYQVFIENLITSFMMHVKVLISDGVDYANKKEDENDEKIKAEFPNLAQFLTWYSSKNADLNLSSQAFQQEGFEVMEKEKQLEMASFISGASFDKEAAKWDFYEESSRLLALYLRPILLEVTFGFHKPNGKILKLIEFLRQHYLKNGDKKTIVLPADICSLIFKSEFKTLKLNEATGEVPAARFEFYVYKKMQHQLDRGRLFCNDSISYCDLDVDLVSDAIVDQVVEIAEKFGYKKIPLYCDERLDEILAELDNAWKRTNENIENGENKDITIETNEQGLVTWKLTYTTEKPQESKFFSELPQIDVADAVRIIGDKTQFWPVFTHLKARYVKCQEPDPSALLGGILANAFGFGVEHMAEISNISYHYLRGVDDNFMHIENLCNVNNVISNFTYGLPVIHAWDLIENESIADGDGQKYETRFQTVQSRYSSKYFGLYKGISVYTLTVNHIPVNAKNISPNDYEGHHLFDLLFNNKTDIRIDRVTGDGHSVNQINFMALDAIDINFIPNINDIHAEAEKLYSSDDPETYTGFFKPHKKINKALIQSQKRYIIRVLLSLILQENTQAVIVKKLSSHKRYCRLNAALWEYNKIFKSIHVLNLINDVTLRKVLKQSRNRTESYHQLQRTIRKVHSGLFVGKTIVNNAINMHASRLVANCIIAYNAMLLNAVYLRLVQKIDEEKAKKIIGKISPVAWQHLIFTGRYRFTNTQSGIDLEQFVEMLEKRLGKIMSKNDI